MMLQRASLASAVLTAASVVLSSALWVPALVLGPAVVLMLVAGAVRDVEDAAHCDLIERSGGPASTPTRAGLPQLTAAISLLVGGVVTLVLSSNDTWWAPVPLSAVVLPLVVGLVARLVGEWWQRDATYGYQHELTFWAWELTEDQLIALEVRLENSRLARVLGLAPFLVVDVELSSPELQRPPRTGSVRR
ncbi:MAG TPA: hypothetical protein VIT65_20180 [Microlunatus sp.]